MRELDVGRLRDAFNRAGDSVRIITLLSPTCPVCRYGQGVVRAIFKEFDTQGLKGFTVWMPTMGGDSAEAARVESKAFADRRMAFAWDPDSQISQLVAKTLKLRGKPWDMYLLYASDVRWEEQEPPQPTFWMCQIPEAGYGVDPKALLNPGRLLEEVRRLLGLGGEPSDPDRPLWLHAEGLDWVMRDREGATLEEIAEALRGTREDDSSD